MTQRDSEVRDAHLVTSRFIAFHFQDRPLYYVGRFYGVLPPPPPGSNLTPQFEIVHLLYEQV